LRPREQATQAGGRGGAGRTGDACEARRGGACAGRRFELSRPHDNTGPVREFASQRGSELVPAPATSGSPTCTVARALRSTL
jgi:hypothetical protein